MKKIISVLISLVFILSLTGALASQTPEFPFGFPGEDDRGTPSPSISEAIQVNIHGRSVILDFDPSAEFSYIKNGLVQASFYSYSADGQYLYEVYLTFPDSVSSGTVFGTEAALEAGLDECCAALLISTENTEDYYLAAQYGEGAYPEGTSYTMRFDSVSSVSGGTLYTGTLTATMVGADINNVPIAEKLVLTDAPFSFTLANGATAPKPYGDAVPSPIPTPTARPDMYRI